MIWSPIQISKENIWDKLTVSTVGAIFQKDSLTFLRNGNRKTLRHYSIIPLTWYFDRIFGLTFN